MVTLDWAENISLPRISARFTDMASNALLKDDHQFCESAEPCSDSVISTGGF